MGNLQSWLGEKRGRAADLAASLGVPRSFVTKMAAGDRPVPIAHMALIERITEGAVTRRDLRPDDWQDIWPELAESEPNQAPAPTQQAQAAINSEAKETAHA